MARDNGIEGRVGAGGGIGVDAAEIEDGGQGGAEDAFGVGDAGDALEVLEFTGENVGGFLGGWRWVLQPGIEEFAATDDDFAGDACTVVGKKLFEIVLVDRVKAVELGDSGQAGLDELVGLMAVEGLESGAAAEHAIAVGTNYNFLDLLNHRRLQTRKNRDVVRTVV